MDLLKRYIKIEPDFKWGDLKDTIYNIFYNRDLYEFYTNDICSDHIDKKLVFNY